MQLLLLLLAQIYTLLQLCFFSLGRNVAWKTVWLYFWVGVFGITAFTFVAHVATTRLIPPEINSYTLNPFVEETLTVLPVLWLLWKNSSGARINLVDGMLLGAALGLGFGLMEEGIRVVGARQEWDLHQLRWPHFFEILFTWLPERLQQPVHAYAGHGITGALMGIGVGAWSQQRRLGKIVFFVLWGWAIWDHIWSNYTLGSWFFEKQWAKTIWSLTGRGRFMPWAIALFLLGNAVYDLLQHWEIRKKQVLLQINSFVDFLSERAPRNPLRSYFHRNWVIAYPWRRLFFLLRIYFYSTVILVLFCNGFIPKTFYRWYLQTPFWWASLFIGIGFSIWGMVRFLRQWRSGFIDEGINAYFYFWGNGLLCSGTILYLLMSLGSFLLTSSGYRASHLFDPNFLFYAFHTFFDFFRDQTHSALAFLGGIGGLIATAHAEEKESKIYQIPSGITKKEGPNGANTDYLRPEIQRIIPTIIQVWQDQGVAEPVITSGNDGDHKPRSGRRSLHYSNLAIDLRGNHFKGEPGKKQLDVLADALQKRLGPDYQVIPESHDKDPQRRHIHVEYDPE